MVRKGLYTVKQYRKKCLKKSLQVKIPGSNNKNVKFRLRTRRTVSHLEILSGTRERVSSDSGGGRSLPPRTDRLRQDEMRR